MYTSSGTRYKDRKMPYWCEGIERKCKQSVIDYRNHQMIQEMLEYSGYISMFDLIDSGKFILKRGAFTRAAKKYGLSVQTVSDLFWKARRIEFHNIKRYNKSIDISKKTSEYATPEIAMEYLKKLKEKELKEAKNRERTVYEYFKRL